MEDEAPATGGVSTGPRIPYEFSPEDYDLFRGLSNRMRYLALLLGILALLGLLKILNGDAVAALVTLLYLVTSVLTFGAAKEIRSLITTDEKNRISDLMAALGSVNNLLAFVVVLVSILLAVGAGAIVVAYIMAALF